MKTKKTRRRMLLEGSKPQMILDIERAFGMGERTWDEGPNFIVNRIHLIGMFDIINKYIFESKLDRTEEKRVVEWEPGINYKASFCSGKVKGDPHCIIVVRSPQKDNFFVLFNTMIHEMIHLYDYQFGPMGKMINENLYVDMLNWGSGYGDVENNLKAAGLERSQLPDGMPNHEYEKIEAGYIDTAKQYQFPKFKHPSYADFHLRTGVDDKRLHPEKYELSETSMYDVHGRFFKRYAAIANYAGFDVSEVFIPTLPHRLRRTWEESESALAKLPPPLENALRRLKSNDELTCEFRNPDNWGIEIA